MSDTLRLLTLALPTSLRIAPRSAGALTSVLRKAVMSRLPDPLPPEISGHEAEDSPHVAYLPLLDAGSKQTSGQVVGAGVLTPNRPELVELLRSSLTDGFTLNFRGTRLKLRPSSEGHAALDPATWCEPARVWSTVTPIVLDRFSGRNKEPSELARTCVHSGLPEPLAVTTSRAPSVPGAADLRPNDLPRKEKRPYTHATLEFPAPIAGPLILGAQRYLGMGLFLPRKP